MDPISAGLLVAVATGAAGEAGKQLWTRLTELVGRRPEREENAPLPVGSAELLSFHQDPQDLDRAGALSSALASRAENDATFRNELAQWHQQAQNLRTGDGETSNTISGGTVNGPVLQGRDFSGINFNGPSQG